MAHCRKCGCDTGMNRRICSSCLSKWSEMRGEAFTFLKNKYGKMSLENLPFLQKEMKRLDKKWKKDPEKFYEEIQDAPQDIAEEKQAIT